MPNPSTYFAGRFDVLAPVACIIDTSLPTFAGIVSATAQNDGTVLVTWATGTSTKTPLRYEIFCSVGSVTAAALFVTANRVAIAPGQLTQWRILTLRDQLTYLLPGQTYTFGVRAVDSQNYTDTNTVILTASPSTPNYGAVAGAVWDQLTASHTVAGSFGLNEQETGADVDEIITTLGTPAGASIAADLAEIEAETDGIAAIPTNPLLTTDSRLNTLDANISSRLATTHFDTIIGTPANASIAADIAEVEADVDLIPINPQLDSVALSQYNSLISALQNIQNNTLFSGIVPDIMNIPSSGTTTYTFYANVFNTSGHPQDPDSNLLNFTVKDNLGNILQAQTAMTRDSAGVYHGTFPVASTAVETSVVVFFNYSVSSISFQQTRTSTISTFANDSANILAIKAKTDNLPTDPASNTNVNTRVATTHFDTVIGTPANASIAADIAEVEAETDGIALIPTNPVLAPHFDSVIGTPVTTVSGDIAEVEVAVDAIQAKTDNLPVDPASESALEAKIATVQALVTAGL